MRDTHRTSSDLIQDRRKALGCQYTDRIQVALEVPSPLWLAAEENLDYLRRETLATTITRGALKQVEPITCEVAGFPTKIYLSLTDT